jgi:hypothetical protein
MLVDTAAITGTGAASPAVVPETIVIDHGKIYVSEHVTSVCQRMGISIQPVRLRTGRDKGPDVHSRGLNPEKDAFFFLDELEAIIREWVATVYHCKPHSSLVDPQVPTLKMSPAQMFEHGIARAGYIEAPRDPDFAYEFLPTRWRTIQHYGVEIDGRRYTDPHGVLKQFENQTSPYTGKAKGRWPIQVDPDDITRTYFRDPRERRWHTLRWEHAPALDMPLSEDALAFARRLAARKYTYPDDKVAVADLLERWNLGLDTLAQRRMALRLSREQATIDLPPSSSPEQVVSSLPSVARVLAVTSEPVSELSDETREGLVEPVEEVGDDDADDFDELDGDEDFYADAFEDV